METYPRVEESNTLFQYPDDDGFIGADCPVHENVAAYSQAPKAERQEQFSYPFPPKFDSFRDNTESEQCDSVENVGRPEVNLKNVLNGMINIATGRNKDDRSVASEQQQEKLTTDGFFLDVEKNGDTYLHSSVYLPSAPPLFEQAVMETDPPEWQPDSSKTECTQCRSPFTALTRGRHHCRFCGLIFCRACTKGRCLLPVKFRERNPQRVCDACYDKLGPLQESLIESISNAAQSAKHDVVDWTCSRGWLNLPVGVSMEQEIYKASSTLKSYSQVSRLNPERSIPFAVLKRAKGLAILTVAKAGALLSYKLGTGLVVSRRPDGSWSPPSAICSVGLGWGAQIGGELMDFIIVLPDLKAVKTFSSRVHFSLGAGCSAAAGPVGRVLEADMRAGDRGSAMCYTYSCSKGAFVGVSLEGNIVATRMDTNVRFYGDPYLTTNDILFGEGKRPKAADPLYMALESLYASLQA